MFGCLSLSGCATAPQGVVDKPALDRDVQTALSQAYAQDPTLHAFLAKAYGYAVFPSVGKGGFGFGAAYGQGEVYERGHLIGYGELRQGTIGLQVGGQTYTEIVAFENKAALDRFQNGATGFAGQASAVALKYGAGANARYADGVSVLTMTEQGFMLEASIGGQSFWSIGLASDVLFDFGRAEIRPGAAPVLARAAEMIRQAGPHEVTIEGHTDDKGAAAYNQRLSEQRAAAVRHWLETQGGVQGVSMTTHGWGATKPIAPNTKPDGSDDPEGRQKNRRVEIVIAK
jgi:outer membrane protein OmpA-like peptidoglycan-associated protein